MWRVLTPFFSHEDTDTKRYTVVSSPTISPPEELNSITTTNNSEIIDTSLRSRRLEVVEERENGRAQGRHYFQAPATQANLTQFA